jgi:hypothetical protein
MTDRKRIQFFGDYLNNLGRPCQAVEVGVHKGEYLFAMVDYCKAVTWFGIDPYTVYKTFSDKFPMPPQTVWDSIYTDTARKIQAHKDRDRIRLIRQSSDKSMDSVPDNLDFVYIDGDHRYESVLRDITVWEPKVRKGGIIGGHDYNKKKGKIFLGVINAVDDYAKQHNRLVNLNVPGHWYWHKS